MTHELTPEAFRSTFGEQMRDVTDEIESSVHIWDYVGELYVEELVSEYVVANELVEKVYRNNTATYDHVVLPTENPHIFLLIIVDLLNENVLGHYWVDIAKDYGLQ